MYYNKPEDQLQIIKEGRLALATNDTSKQRELLSQLQKTCSQTVTRIAFQKTQQLLPGCKEISLLLLTPDEVRINLESYLDILTYESQIGTAYVVNHNSIALLYINRENPQAVLYQKNHSHLTVSNFLDVIGYTNSVAYQAGIPTENLQLAVTGLKVLNQMVAPIEEKNTPLKQLGLAVEVIAEAGKLLTSDETMKKNVNLTSALFNLTIDYLTEG